MNKQNKQLTVCSGIWAVNFQKHPETDVLGADLSPIQPPFVPPNLHLTTYTAGTSCRRSKYPKMALQRIYDNLRPGDYVEIMETLMKIESVDDSLDNTVIPQWHHLMLDGINRMDRPDPMIPLKTQAAFD